MAKRDRLTADRARAILAHRFGKEFGLVSRLADGGIFTEKERVWEITQNGVVINEMTNLHSSPAAALVWLNNRQEGK